MGLLISVTLALLFIPVPDSPNAGQSGIQKIVRREKDHKHNEPTKKGPLSFVPFESLFNSVSTVRRGHPSLVETEVNVDSRV